MNDEKKKEIAEAVGHIPSGLFIVCAQDEKDKKIDGFLGSWIQQVSFDPLLITLAVKPGRPASDHILERGIFSVNVVGDHEKKFMGAFWSGYNPEKNPFADISHRITEEGGVVIDDAKSAIVCQMVEQHKPGDHHLVVAKVLKSVVNNSESKSMTHTRKSGLDY